jgi:hypothetical protein
MKNQEALIAISGKVNLKTAKLISLLQYHVIDQETPIRVFVTDHDIFEIAAIDVTSDRVDLNLKEDAYIVTIPAKEHIVKTLSIVAYRELADLYQKDGLSVPCKKRKEIEKAIVENLQKELKWK